VINILYFFFSFARLITGPADRVLSLLRYFTRCCWSNEVEKKQGGKTQITSLYLLENLMSRSNSTRRVVLRSAKAVSGRLIRTGLVFYILLTVHLVTNSCK